MARNVLTRKNLPALTFGLTITSASIMMFLTTSNGHMSVAKILANLTNHVSAGTSLPYHMVTPSGITICVPHPFPQIPHCPSKPIAIALQL